jgi:transposase
MKVAGELLGNLHDAYVAGDRAYDAQALVQQLQQLQARPSVLRRRLVAPAARDPRAQPAAQQEQQQGCQVVIPSNPTRKTQREIDRHLYRERHLVENLFQLLKRFRRLAMRFEKLAESFLAFLHLGCILVWLR